MSRATADRLGLQRPGPGIRPGGPDLGDRHLRRYLHALALRSGGTVTAWGQNNNGQATVPAHLTRVVAIAAGGFYSLALRSDDTVVARGDNGQGQTSVPADVTGVTANRPDEPGGSGIDSVACTTTTTSTGEGEGEQTLQATCADQAGNIGEAAYVLKVDTISPTLAPTLSPNLGGVPGWIVPPAERSSPPSPARRRSPARPPMSPVGVRGLRPGHGRLHRRPEGPQVPDRGSVVPITITVRLDTATIATGTTSVTVAK